METLGQRIRRFRKALNLSQDDLGQRIGLKQATISQYEADSIDIPASQFPLLARALNVAESALMDSQARAPKQSVEQRRLEAIRLILTAERLDIENVIFALESARKASGAKNG